MARNIALYPWFRFMQSLTFWQATWFLYFDARLSAAEAILLYVVYDLATTVLEVPSGYMSDRLGRRPTLLAAAICGFCGVWLLVVGGGFWQFALGIGMLGAGAAFTSGTDSSLNFESLRAAGRASEVEASELKAWRYGFVALALSAVSGGAMAMWADVLPFVATGLAALGVLAIALAFEEPPHAPRIGHRENLALLIASLRNPTLLWLLCLALVMYVFSHIPFVFGQPFIRAALDGAGHGAQAPLVSGAVTSIMMVISVLVSLVALPVRARLGLWGVLLLAFGMQVALTGALAASNGVFVIGLLFLRMVPDSLSQPFIKARVLPLLGDGLRATYLSVQSLAGRVLFAVTLSAAAGQTAGDAPLPYEQMQGILGAYALFGLILLGLLAATARRARV